MKTFIFKVFKITDTVGTYNVDINIDIDANNISTAEKKFKKQCRQKVKEAGWIATDILYNTFLYDPDHDNKKYLQTFSMNL